MSDSFVGPWTVTRQAPLSMGFSRQECWSGLPFPLPGALLDPRIDLRACALAGRFFTTEPPGKQWDLWIQCQIFLLALSHFSLVTHTHTHTHLHMHAHTFTHLYLPLLPLHVHFRSLYLKPSSPTNFTFISNLHLLCPQPEFINCSFNILIKFSVRHFNILASPSIPFCFPGDSLLEPLALLTHPGLAGLDTSHTAGTSSWEFHFPHSCWIPIFSDFYVFHYFDNFPYFYGEYPAALSFFLATLCSMQDLSSLTGDWTHIPCSRSSES